MKCNNEIRNTAKVNGIKLWELACLLAGEIGVADTTFSRWLRVEFTEQQKEIVMSAMKRIIERRDNHG